MATISAVLNVLNEEKNIARVLQSLKWVDEIVVVDDGSTDNTVEIAKIYTKKIYRHKSAGFVEPARNFDISRATGEWILLLDADEEIPQRLAEKLRDISGDMKEINYIDIPRKNLIFGKWIQNSFWWPDYHPRFFRKGKVVWKNQIHSKPQLEGKGIKLEPVEQFAIIHNHYTNLNQFIERNFIRYSKQQAKELMEQGYKFQWLDVISKPLGEFLSRYFANQGYKDGLHGLSLSLLQALSFLIVYLRVWEMEKFKGQDITFEDIKQATKMSSKEINYWLKYGNLSKNPFKRFFQKAKNRVL